MVYVRIEVGNGYSGCDSTYYKKYEDGEFDEKIVNEYAEQCAYVNADECSHVVTDWDGNFEDELDEMEYYSDLSYEWVIITKEEYEEEN